MNSDYKMNDQNAKANIITSIRDRIHLSMYVRGILAQIKRFLALWPSISVQKSSLCVISYSDYVI